MKGSILMAGDFVGAGATAGLDGWYLEGIGPLLNCLVWYGMVGAVFGGAAASGG